MSGNYRLRCSLTVAVVVSLSGCALGPPPPVTGPWGAPAPSDARTVADFLINLQQSANPAIRKTASEVLRLKRDVGKEGRLAALVVFKGWLADLTAEELDASRHIQALLNTIRRAFWDVTKMPKGSVRALANVARFWLNNPDKMPGPQDPNLADLRELIVNVSVAPDSTLPATSRPVEPRHPARPLPPRKFAAPASPSPSTAGRSGARD